MIRFNPWWITGLIDGEGCFHVATRRQKSGKVIFRTHFKIEVAYTDIVMIRGIKRYCGCGKIYKINYINKPGRKYRSNSAAYWINKKTDLCKLIKHLSKYPLQSKKKKDYRLWLKAHQLVKQKKNLRPEFTSIFNNIRSKMNLEKGKNPQTLK